MCFDRMDSSGLSRYLNSIFTQVTIHPPAANHIGASLISLRVCESWWGGWMKMVRWESMTDHWEKLWFWLQNPISKICHGTSTSGGCLCTTKNLNSSLSHLTYLYLSVMIRCRTLTHKKSIYFCVYLQ